MIVYGVDPGINGGLAVVSAQRANVFMILLDARDVPVVGDGSKREVNVPDLCAWIERYRTPDAVAYIELVHAMPSIPDEETGVRRGMGAASAFKFGFACGQIRAAFASRGVRIELVVPAKWKKLFGLVGGDKEPSRQLAIRKWPAHADMFARKKDHQRAEAALLAAYGGKLEL